MRTKFLATLSIAVLLLSACGGGNQNKKDTDKKEDVKTENDTKTMDEQKSLTNVTILIETTEGNIKAKLYDETPLHRDNFVKLVKDHFYDGVIFHRVISNFMIQGGDPDSKNPQPDARYGSGGPGYTIPAEFNSTLFHKKGALAAARLGDQANPEKASSGSQFYIVQGQKFPDAKQVNPNTNYTAEQLEIYKTLGGTPHLDGGYTVFGEVIEGLNIVDKIALVQTAPGDRPIKDVIIKKIIIAE
ncbi:MAG: peptidylprolyl isomerase [Prevotellaceae bacterium]|jgi:peptidyl-prolyl cis-trans isomerase B (cyclophilin B)|nr:peptidylprolyl isomerase [Prevotellaceae bacterium]